MLFSSILFLFYFLPIVLALYFIVPVRFRNLLLLLASLLFYAWGEPVFVGLMLLSIGLNYGLGLLVASENRAFAKAALVGAVVVNLSILGLFKYANFFVDNLNGLAGYPAIVIPAIALPIGISFFTFQAMSYVFDVYRQQTPVQKNPLDLALYIALFPQLIAGPIVRYRDIADQLLERRITPESFTAGIHRFVIGLAKKVLIANVVAQTADHIFTLNAADTPIGSTLAWLGIICYTLQIFYDFSGYSDMAIGLGLMFGFRFPENFNVPYSARSIQEFWRHWHMTLSTWFRDYVYIPLGGNRKGVARTYLNLYIVFFLTGLWHGASWNFVLWGLLHGTFLVIERLGFAKVLEKMWRPLAHFYTLLVVMVAWVFFRAETLPQAISYLARMFSFTPENAVHSLDLYLDVPLAVTLTLGVIFTMPLAAWFQKWRDTYTSARQQHLIALLGTAAMGGLFIFSAAALAVNTYNPFIYFRF